MKWKSLLSCYAYFFPRMNRNLVFEIIIFKTVMTAIMSNTYTILYTISSGNGVAPLIDHPSLCSSFDIRGIIMVWCHAKYNIELAPIYLIGRNVNHLQKMITKLQVQNCQTKEKTVDNHIVVTNCCSCQVSHWGQTWVPSGTLLGAIRDCP